MKKKWTALIVGIAFLCTGLGISAPAQAANPGVYTANVVTSYYNPDTGGIDDQGGEANAALGEGMCRSAVATTGLVEVDQNGRTWVTVRMLLQSNSKNLSIQKRVGKNSYARVNYAITAENSASDSMDCRIQVPNAGTKLKMSMYVTPMGRDVVWYTWVNPASMKSGSGNFVVSIDTQTSAPKPQAKPNTQNKGQAVNADKDPDKEKDRESEEADKEKDSEEMSEEELSEEEKEQMEEEAEGKDQDTKEAESKDGGEESEGMPIGAAVGVVVGIIALLGIIYYIRKKQ